ncbi:MAG: hypothetical protein IPO32_20500 [Crocinitomicaceae bacterium]|nr:hypothetical protein [Crocinitomicaceae bacterium]
MSKSEFFHLNKFESILENIDIFHPGIRGLPAPWVTNEKHFISDFNQDLTQTDKEFPPIWKILADNKIKGGVFGSLHSYPLPQNFENYSFVLDVFASFE